MARYGLRSYKHSEGQDGADQYYDGAPVFASGSSAPTNTLPSESSAAANIVTVSPDDTPEASIANLRYQQVVSGQASYFDYPQRSRMDETFSHAEHQEQANPEDVASLAQRTQDEIASLNTIVAELRNLTAVYQAELEEKEVCIRHQERKIETAENELRRLKDSNMDQRGQRLGQEVKLTAVLQEHKKKIEVIEKEHRRQLEAAKNNAEMGKQHNVRDSEEFKAVLRAKEALDEEVIKMSNTISELNGDLAKVGNSRPVGQHDDAYFEAAFGRIFEECNQWARNLCRTRPGVRGSEPILSKTFMTVLEEMGHGSTWFDRFHQEPARMVESTLVWIIVRDVLKERVLQFMGKDMFRYTFNDILSPQDEATLRERVLTFHRLQNQTTFQEALHNHLDDKSKVMYEDFLNFASPPSKPQTEDRRRKQNEKRRQELLKMIKDGANVFLDIMQEPAQFIFKFPRSGSSVNLESMQVVDVVGATTHDQIVEIGATPAIWKKKPGASSTLILRKSKVYLRVLQSQPQSERVYRLSAVGRECPQKPPNLKRKTCDGVGKVSDTVIESVNQVPATEKGNVNIKEGEVKGDEDGGVGLNPPPVRKTWGLNRLWIG